MAIQNVAANRDVDMISTQGRWFLLNALVNSYITPALIDQMQVPFWFGSWNNSIASFNSPWSAK
jgi:hypothetical protein